MPDCVLQVAYSDFSVGCWYESNGGVYRYMFAGETVSVDGLLLTGTVTAAPGDTEIFIQYERPTVVLCLGDETSTCEREQWLVVEEWPVAGRLLCVGANRDLRPHPADSGDDPLVRLEPARLEILVSLCKAIANHMLTAEDTHRRPAGRETEPR